MVFQKISKIISNTIHNLVNRLEASLDDFLERRLGEKKETESELHWGVIDFIIHLSNSPTNAHEIENPVKEVRFDVFFRIFYGIF